MLSKKTSGKKDDARKKGRKCEIVTAILPVEYPYMHIYDQHFSMRSIHVTITSVPSLRFCG